MNMSVISDFWGTVYFSFFVGLLVRSCSDNARWVRLALAAQHAGHVWTGRPHSALADALAARSVARYLDSL